MSEWAQATLRHVSFTCAAVVGVVSMAGALWLFVRAFRGMIVRLPIQLQTPTAATARVRHERSFTGDGARLHDFRFDFSDEVDGRVHQVSASVPGFFGLWSDRRFDYLALARFIRADCGAERPALLRVRVERAVLERRRAYRVRPVGPKPVSRDWI
jgi:hypothetical protein